MVKVQLDMTEKAHKNLRIYMAEQRLDIKSTAINKILEELNFEIVKRDDKK